MSNNEIVQGFDDEKCDGLTIKLKVINEVENCLLVYMIGHINTYNSDAFQKQGVKAIQAGYIRIIFDCTELTHISSSGAGSFSLFLKLVKSQGGNLVLLGIKPKVYGVFQVLGSAQVFTLRDTLDESISLFQGNVKQLTGSLPKVLNCPVCSKQIVVQRWGQVRCSACKALLVIDKRGQVFFDNK